MSLSLVKARTPETFLRMDLLNSKYCWKIRIEMQAITLKKAFYFQGEL